MGREMSLALAEAGAKVAMIDIDEDVLMAAARDAEAAGGQGCALPIVCDVTDADRAAATRDEILDRFGRLDMLVNDAVVGPERIGDNFFHDPPKFWELGDALWRQMLEVNVYGPQLMARTVVPTMLEAGRGRIVNVTTSLNTMYRAGAGCYGPSKAALEAHTHIMAHDLDGTGVTANVLIPGGPVNTRMIPVASGVDRAELIQPTSDARAGRLALLGRFRRRQRHALHRPPLGCVPAARGTHRGRRRPRRLDPARRAVGPAGLSHPLAPALSPAGERGNCAAPLPP